MFFNKAPRARPLFFLARSAGLAYLQVPKVACTSFKVAMALMNRPELATELNEAPMQIHRRSELSDIVAAGDASLESLFRFTFVRNPLGRFVSFYQDKILHRTKGVLPPAMVEAGFVLGMPLDQALDRIEATPPANLDPHIAPQSWFGFDQRKPRVNFIGRVESLEADLLRLAEASGVRVELGHHNKTAKQNKPHFELSAKDEERILKFYAEDFELLGYA